MILSDKDLKKALAQHVIVITPEIDYDTQMGSCMIDLRLGNQFRVFQRSSIAVIDPRQPGVMEETTDLVQIQDKDEAFILHPGEFALGVTKEHLEVPDFLIGRLEGRSSIGRLGVIIHSTAAHVHPGFRGTITLELANMGQIPVKLYPGMRICSISFEQLSTPAEVPYNKQKDAKYVGQKQPGVSKISTEEMPS